MSSNACKSYSMGKKQKFFVILSLLCIFLFNVPESLFSQCQPYIKINGKRVLANQTVAAGLSLPLWLSENQTLAVDQMVNSISVIEFNVTGSTLEFSNVLSITSTTPQVVPAGKVWKIESISKKPVLSDEDYGVAYTNAGTYTFVVPSCASYICIEVWGGGGGGGGGYYYYNSYSGSYYYYGGGGGGGGGYGQGCFNVTPGSNYTVTVGAAGAGGAYGNPASAGGAGGTSSVGSLISATGGNGGGGGVSGVPGTGGTGGTSTASVYVAGGNGQNGIGPNGGTGGSSGSGPALNGGAGGAGGIYASSITPGSKGSVPGGGGGGGYGNGSSSCSSGGSGACGGVIITW